MCTISKLNMGGRTFIVVIVVVMGGRTLIVVVVVLCALKGVLAKS